MLAAMHEMLAAPHKMMAAPHVMLAATHLMFAKDQRGGLMCPPGAHYGKSLHPLTA